MFLTIWSAVLVNFKFEKDHHCHIHSRYCREWRTDLCHVFFYGYIFIKIKVAKEYVWYLHEVSRGTSGLVFIDHQGPRLLPALCSLNLTDRKLLSYLLSSNLYFIQEESSPPIAPFNGIFQKLRPTPHISSWQDWSLQRWLPKYLLSPLLFDRVTWPLTTPNPIKFFSWILPQFFSWILISLRCFDRIE